jgi:hypothetical protein
LLHFAVFIAARVDRILRANVKAVVKTPRQRGAKSELAVWKRIYQHAHHVLFILTRPSVVNLIILFQKYLDLCSILTGQLVLRKSVDAESKATPRSWPKTTCKP